MGRARYGVTRGIKTKGQFRQSSRDFISSPAENVGKLEPISLRISEGVVKLIPRTRSGPPPGDEHRPALVSPHQRWLQSTREPNRAAVRLRSLLARKAEGSPKMTKFSLLNVLQGALPLAFPGQDPPVGAVLVRRAQPGRTHRRRPPIVAGMLPAQVVGQLGATPRVQLAEEVMNM